MTRRRALFLDRDGVINVDHGYVSSRDNFEFMEGIFELCRRAKQLGLLIVVVTNQAGIGRGYYSEQDFLELTKWMRGVFDDQGAPIDKVYYCPYHAELGIGIYKAESPFRKPAPGMILQAADELGIDLGRSILIGDKDSDIQAGRAAGVGVNLLYVPLRLEPHRAEAAGAFATIGKLADAIPYFVSDSSEI